MALAYNCLTSGLKRTHPSIVESREPIFGDPKRQAQSVQAAVQMNAEQARENSTTL